MRSQQRVAANESTIEPTFPRWPESDTDSSLDWMLSHQRDCPVSCTEWIFTVSSATILGLPRPEFGPESVLGGPFTRVSGRFSPVSAESVVTRLLHSPSAHDHRWQDCQPCDTVEN